MTATWFTEFVRSVAEGEATYLHCESCGATGLAPRRTLPGCSTSSIAERELPSTAVVVSHTEITNTIPKFSGQTPYTIVISEFDGGVRLTGQLRGADTVDIGDEVELGAEAETDDDWILTFQPVDS